MLALFKKQTPQKRKRLDTPKDTIGTRSPGRTSACGVRFAGSDEDASAKNLDEVVRSGTQSNAQR
jgi:hypothetical protein